MKRYFPGSSSRAKKAKSIKGCNIDCCENLISLKSKPTGVPKNLQNN